MNVSVWLAVQRFHLRALIARRDMQLSAHQQKLTDQILAARERLLK